MYKKKSQISVEYMMIIGFVTLITIPLILIYHSFMQDSGDEIRSVQVKQVAQKIVDTAESVYYLGEPSQTTVKLNIPSNVILTNLSNNELVFKIKTRSGTSDIVQSSSVNISGALPTREGTYTLTIQAKSNYVQISYK